MMDTKVRNDYLRTGVDPEPRLLVDWKNELDTLSANFDTFEEFFRTNIYWELWRLKIKRVPNSIFLIFHKMVQEVYEQYLREHGNHRNHLRQMFLPGRPEAALAGAISLSTKNTSFDADIWEERLSEVLGTFVDGYSKIVQSLGYAYADDLASTIQTYGDSFSSDQTEDRRIPTLLTLHAFSVLAEEVRSLSDEQQLTEYAEFPIQWRLIMLGFYEKGDPRLDFDVISNVFFNKDYAVLSAPEESEEAVELMCGRGRHH